VAAAPYEALESRRVSSGELEAQTTLHLHPTAPLAERVLLPGDPGRALMLAQLLLAEPKMFNHNRGLWGYTGTAADGDSLTIQSTGMGGPSAAIVLHELVALGARRAIRVGTCGALLATLELGDLVVASEAICADGTSRAIGVGDRASADPRLNAALLGSAPAALSGAVVSVDLFYEDPARTREHDAIAVEMEAAALFALGATLRVAVGCMLCVSDTFAEDGERTHIDADTLRESVERMGAHALAALRC
jgi:DeoD family purine-nucleoside phosphorylase